MVGRVGVGEDVLACNVGVIVYCLLYIVRASIRNYEVW